MLTLKNNTLEINGEIVSADFIIKLHTDIDCNYIGVLSLSDNSTKVINFVKQNNIYKARLVITEEDLPYINNVSMYLVLTDSNFRKNTNTVTVSFNLNKIKKAVRISKSNDLKEVKVKVAQLSKQLETILSQIPTVVATQLSVGKHDYIKPGMVPVAIDDKGRCIFQHPFLDVITEINGQKTINSAILLTAKDIPIEQTDVESAIKAHTEAIKELNSYMKTVSSELKKNTNKIAELEKVLIQHTDSSII